MPSEPPIEVGGTASPGRPAPGGASSVRDVLAVGLRDFPDREFLVGAKGRVSYAEFDRWADRAARALTALGVERGDRVAMSLPSDLDAVVIFHGVLRIGAIWLGVNRNLALPEKVFILADAGAKLAIADPEVASGVAGERAKGILPALERVVVCDRDAAVGGCEWTRMVEGASSTAIEAVVSPSDPAALAYTSGTTGFPKGVLHSHHNLLVPGASQKEAFDLRPGTRRGLAFPLTILNVQVLASLLVAQHGGTCVLIDRMDAKGIAEWIRRERVTSFTGAPAQLYGLANDPSIQPADLASLDRVSTGGANCPEETLAAFESRFGHPVGLSYGLTEAPTAVAMDPDPAHRAPGASGRPLPHCEITIRDDDDRELSVAEVGEVCVGPHTTGPWAGVYTPMLGYWGRDAETAEALRGGRLRTGDLGRLDEAGYLHIVDRKKRMLVRGGANVYPAEIERVLHGDARVADCLVVGVPDDRLGERIAAWVEVAEGVAADAEWLDALRQRCADQLARYKVPERIVVTDALPRNEMGKVQADRLPTIELDPR